MKKIQGKDWEIKSGNRGAIGKEQRLNYNSKQETQNHKTASADRMQVESKCTRQPVLMLLATSDLDCPCPFCQCTTQHHAN